MPLLQSLESVQVHLAPIDESIRPISASGTLPPKRDAWGLFLIIAGSLGLGFGLLISAVLAIFSLFGQQPIALGVEAAAFLALGLLGAPAIYWGAKGSAKRAERKPDRVWVLALLLYPLALFLGALAFEAGTLPRLLGPIAHILAAGAPVLFVVSVSLSRGPLLSARRRWAHFLAGLWVTPPLTLTIELISLVPLGLLMILGLALTPDGEALFRELLAVEIGSEQQIELATRLISQPIVILLGVGMLSGVVPIIEELLKSLTIWPLLTRPMTSGQAFLGGTLGGAGYSLFESLFLPQVGEEWVLTMVARGGTPLIHAFNAGLVCWGLAEGVRRKRWLLCAGTYILAVGLHGLWNLSAIGIGLSGLGLDLETGYLDPVLMSTLGYLGLLGLLGLAVGSLAGLIWLPARLDAEGRARPRRT